VTEHVVDISCSTESVDEEPEPQQIVDWLTNALFLLDCDRSAVSVRIVSAEEMRSLNRRYSERDKATNVLSFSSGVKAEGRLFLGDIVICDALVRKEARDFDKPVKDRYAHMVVHGLLHLLGYDHSKLEDQKKMESLEKSLLATLNIHDPYEQTVSVTEKM